MVLQSSVTERFSRLAGQLGAQLRQRWGDAQRLGRQWLRSNDSDRSSPSVVVEYIVPKGKSWAFRGWHRRMVKSARGFEGFVRADRYRPLALPDDCLKWYTVLHFEQPDQLKQWLQSSDRDTVLKSGRDIFKSYKFNSFETGMEGWFNDQSGEELTSLGPPAWKEILAVVLGLYPIIMVQGFILERLEVFEDWDPASAMLANNLITTCILTLIVMPRIVRWLNFWLRPAHRRSPAAIEVVGTVVTVMAMAAMVYVFSGLS